MTDACVTESFGGVVVGVPVAVAFGEACQSLALVLVLRCTGCDLSLFSSLDMSCWMVGLRWHFVTCSSSVHDGWLWFTVCFPGDGVVWAVSVVVRPCMYLGFGLSVSKRGGRVVA